MHPDRRMVGRCGGVQPRRAAPLVHKRPAGILERRPWTLERLVQ